MKRGKVAPVFRRTTVPVNLAQDLFYADIEHTKGKLDPGAKAAVKASLKRKRPERSTMRKAEDKVEYQALPEDHRPSRLRVGEPRMMARRPKNGD